MSRASHSRRRGTMVFEFTIGSTLLLAAFMGAFQYGYTFLQYNRLQNAVLQGAHYAALIPYDSPNATPTSSYTAAVRNMVMFGSPTTGARVLVPGLSAQHVTVRMTLASGVPSTVTVAITGYTINGLFGTHTLTGKPQVTFPYQGIWAPV